MFHILWRFRAKREELDEYVRIYGTAGTWAQFFSRSPDYRGTQLLRGTADPLTFVIIDRWTAEEAFVRFKAQYATEYEELDRRCELLTESEEKIGSYVSEE
jgi:hypothetical protein